MLVFLTWTNLSALHWFRCEWRSKPVTGLRQVCQPRISKVGSLPLLHGVTSGCYGRRKAANFHWAEDGSGQPPLAACEQEWTLYVRLVWTCSGSRAGHQNKEAAVCVCTSTRSAPGVVTKEAEQNWSKCNFHFCYSEREEKKKKNCHSQKLYPQLDFFF